MSTPDLQAVREIARELILNHAKNLAQDDVTVFESVIEKDACIPLSVGEQESLADDVLAEIGRVQIAVSWPDEQQAADPMIEDDATAGDCTMDCIMGHSNEPGCLYDTTPKPDETAESSPMTTEQRQDNTVRTRVNDFPEPDLSPAARVFVGLPERAQAEEKQQDGAVEAARRFANAWRENNSWSRAHLPSEDGRRHFGDAWFQISGTDAKLTEPQLRAVLAERDDFRAQLRTELAISAKLRQRNVELATERCQAEAERTALAARVAELEGERKADTRLVAVGVIEDLWNGDARPNSVIETHEQLHARFADRIAALDADTDGGAE